MKKGFTLVEMMIVIALIGVLSAMIIPNFVEARKRVLIREEERKELLVSYLEKSLQEFLITFEVDVDTFLSYTVWQRRYNVWTITPTK